MDLIWSLLIWLVVVIVIYLIAKANRVRAWSALVLGLLVGSITLGILRPININEITYGGNNLTATLYWLIMFVTPIILIIYIVSKAVTDIQPVTDINTVNGASRSNFGSFKNLFPN